MDDVVEILNSVRTPYSFVSYASKQLKQAGYCEVREHVGFDFSSNKIFVIRDSRSIIAVNFADLSRAIIVASHTDSACLKSKPNSRLIRYGLDEARIQLHGKADWSQWFDRELNISGRIIYERDGHQISTVFESEKPIAVIPSPHHPQKLNLELHFVPIVSLSPEASTPHSNGILDLLEDSADADYSDLLDWDLSFLPSDRVAFLGASCHLLSGFGLDALSGAVSNLRAFLSGDPTEGARIFAAFDDSLLMGQSRVGASSQFVRSILELIGFPESSIARSVVFVTENGSSVERGILLGSETFNSIKIAKSLGIPFHLSDPNVENEPKIGRFLGRILGVPVSEVGISIQSRGTPRELVFVDDLNCLNRFLMGLYETALPE